MKFTAYDEIERWEGLRLEAYKDVVGVWTIGYGHTGVHAKPGNVITRQQAKDILDADLKLFVDNLNKVVKVGINQNQFDALTLLSFNIGVGGFNGSTVLRRLNAGDFRGCADAFLMWNKGRIGGKLVEIKGLTNRRKAERELFLTAASPVVITPTPSAQPDLFEEQKYKMIEELLTEYTDKLMTILEK